MNERINEKLGAWLLDDNNTRAKLAEVLGISRPTLNSRLEGSSKWYWDDVLKIAELTKSTLDDLAGIPADKVAVS